MYKRQGYIQRSRERDEKGRLRGADYVIFELPQPVPCLLYTSTFHNDELALIALGIEQIVRTACIVTVVDDLVGAATLAFNFVLVISCLLYTSHSHNDLPPVYAL